MCTEQTWDCLSNKKNNDCDYKVLKKKIQKFCSGEKKGEGGKLVCHQHLSSKFVIKVKEFSIYLSFLGETTGYLRLIRKISSSLFNQECLLLLRIKREKGKLNKSLFDNHQWNDGSKDHQQTWTPVPKRLLKNGHSSVLKYFSTDYLLITKGTTSYPYNEEIWRLPP